MIRSKTAFSLLIFFSFLLSGCFKEEFGGLGIEVPAGDEKVSSKNQFKILSVFKGGTAERYGLKKNDVIKSVDGIDLIGKRKGYIVKNLLRGKVGTTVTLEIIRNDTIIVFRVTRGKIILEK